MFIEGNQFDLPSSSLRFCSAAAARSNKPDEARKIVFLRLTFEKQRTNLLVRMVSSIDPLFSFHYPNRHRNLIHLHAYH